MSTGRPIVFFPLMLLSASLSLAQVSTDPTGAVISRAKVIATNADTGVSREASSDAAGAYVMTLLPPGNYNLSVEAQGCCAAESPSRSISGRAWTLRCRWTR
jgi:carboxypeptidase family protein